MKYDGFLFGNGLTLNLLYQLKEEVPKERQYLLNVDDFLHTWVKGELTPREERYLYSALYGNQKDKWKYFEIMKNEIELYYKDFDSNIEYVIGKTLFNKEEHNRIVQLFPALYNIWFIVLNEYLNYIGLNSKITSYYERIKEYIGNPRYIWTTNYDKFAECLNPQHLHGRFMDNMKKYEDVIYKRIKGGKEYYYKYVWGHNGIGKMNNINQVMKFKDHDKYFDFAFFNNDNILVNNLLIFGMGFKKSGFTEDLKTKYDRYEHPAFGAIIDEHILIRIRELQEKNKIQRIDISYYDENEKLYLQEVMQEMEITKYRLVKCQDFDFKLR